MKSATRTVILSEHFKCFSAADVRVEIAADLLQERLRECGPTIRSDLRSFEEAKSYLLPIKSFTTRFLVVGFEGWSIIISDMWRENCLSNAFLLSRAAKCDTITICFQEQRREFTIHKNGEEVRLIESASDGDRWHYREAGTRLQLESPSEYGRPRRGDRLSVEAARRYFAQFTGFDTPVWPEASFASIIGLERSIKDLMFPLTKFKTIDDFAEGASDEQSPMRVSKSRIVVNRPPVENASSGPMETSRPPDYLVGKANAANPIGPGRHLTDGAWCGHGESSFNLFDIRSGRSGLFHVRIGREDPPAVELRAPASRTPFFAYDSRAHPASLYFGKSLLPRIGKPLICDECGHRLFRIAVGFATAWGSEDPNDASWFAIALECGSCHWGGIVFDDEIA